MAYYFFTIPVCDSTHAENDLNQFIAQNKVLTVEKNFVADSNNSFWSLCVATTESQESFSTSSRKSKRSSIDYKEVLSADDFTIFAGVRKLRKEIAESQGIPAYAVFNNEQLAKMVTEKISTKTEMMKIEGVGQSRIDKYSESFLSRLQQNV